MAYKIATVDPKFTAVIFNQNSNSSKQGGGASVTTINTTQILTFNNGNLFELYNNTATTQPAIAVSSSLGNGVNLSSVLQSGSQIIEITEGVTAASKSNYTEGTSPPFYVQAKFKITTDNLVNALFIGWRKQQGYNATLSNYTDFATIGIVGTNSPAKIQIQTQAASGGVTTTDTTNTWASGTTHTLRVLVSGSGAGDVYY